jgi:hypothetical protein
MSEPTPDTPPNSPIDPAAPMLEYHGTLRPARVGLRAASVVSLIPFAVIKAWYIVWSFWETPSVRAEHIVPMLLAIAILVASALGDLLLIRFLTRQWYEPRRLFWLAPFLMSGMVNGSAACIFFGSAAFGGAPRVFAMFIFVWIVGSAILTFTTCIVRENDVLPPPDQTNH